MMIFNPFAHRFCIMVAQVSSFFGSEILFLIGVEVLFHLFYDMFCLMKILHLQVRGGFYYLMCMAALVTEFPFLEMVHVRKGTAGRAPDNEVHGKDVMRVTLLKIFRRRASYSPALGKNRYLSGACYRS
jgi:hypothetical protein